MKEKWVLMYDMDYDTSGQEVFDSSSSLLDRLESLYQKSIKEYPNYDREYHVYRGLEVEVMPVETVTKFYII